MGLRQYLLKAMRPPVNRYISISKRFLVEGWWLSRWRNMNSRAEVANSKSPLKLPTELLEPNQLRQIILGMWNQDGRSSGRPRARRNRISGGFSRMWAWTRKHVFRNRRMMHLEFTTRVPSTLSDESFSNWEDPVAVRQSTTSEGVRPIPPERREITPRKRFQDRKLDHDHIVRVTKALHDEMKKNSQEKRMHAPEPHLPTSASITKQALKDK